MALATAAASLAVALSGLGLLAGVAADSAVGALVLGEGAADAGDESGAGVGAVAVGEVST